MIEAEKAGYTAARRGIIASRKSAWGKLNLFSADVSGGDCFGYEFATRVTLPLWSEDVGLEALVRCVSLREIRSETIRLTEEKNRVGQPGCYAAAYLNVSDLIAEFEAAVDAITPAQVDAAMAAVRAERCAQAAEWAAHEAELMCLTAGAGR